MPFGLRAADVAAIAGAEAVELPEQPHCGFPPSVWRPKRSFMLCIGGVARPGMLPLIECTRACGW